MQQTALCPVKVLLQTPLAARKEAFRMISCHGRIMTVTAHEYLQQPDSIRTKVSKVSLKLLWDSRHWELRQKRMQRTYLFPSDKVSSHIN